MIGSSLSLDVFHQLTNSSKPITLEPACLDRVKKSHAHLQTISGGQIVYGLNTGFGPMADQYISPSEQTDLQYNLVRSHASGSGSPLSSELCRTIMLVRLQTLGLGHSGVHPNVVRTLISFLNAGVHPVVYEHGSVGASGDLVQLAHIALGLIGEGNVWYQGSIRPCAEVLAELEITPLQLSGRDGLALINGTAAMTAIGIAVVQQAEQLFATALKNTALLFEIASVHSSIFSNLVSELRPHPGQKYVIDALQKLLTDSSRCQSDIISHLEMDEIDGRQLTHNPQEIYSLRCAPQVLGPIYEAIEHAKTVLTTELNSVTDNPLIGNDGSFTHNGNFHGDYVAYEMDCLKIAMTKLSLLAERQIHYLMHSRINGILPPFLNNGTLGVQLGLQGLQFTATSTAAENQTLANPMSIHSIATNGDNQDIVSMGTNSALLARKVVMNVAEIYAIHSIALVQAIRILAIEKSLPQPMLAYWKDLSDTFPALAADRTLQPDVTAMKNHLQSYQHEPHRSDA